MNRRKTGAGPAKDHSVTDGHVRWTYIDNLCIPCIIREGKPHGPVRILEKELLNRLSSIDAVNAAFQNRQLLVSKYLTDVEVMQLNHFSAGTFGVFTSKDLVVDIQEFRELYSYVKSVLHRPNSVVTGGWVQVNNRWVLLTEQICCLYTLYIVHDFIWRYFLHVGLCRNSDSCELSIVYS